MAEKCQHIFMISKPRSLFEIFFKISLLLLNDQFFYNFLDSIKKEDDSKPKSASGRTVSCAVISCNFF